MLTYLQITVNANNNSVAKLTSTIYGLCSTGTYRTQINFNLNQSKHSFRLCQLCQDYVRPSSRLDNQGILSVNLGN